MVDSRQRVVFGSRLVVDGNNYCGSSGPVGVEAGGWFSWSSGGSSQVKGWSIRAGVLPTPAPAPSPTSHILVFEGLYLWVSCRSGRCLWVFSHLGTHTTTWSSLVTNPRDEWTMVSRLGRPTPSCSGHQITALLIWCDGMGVYCSGVAIGGLHVCMVLWVLVLSVSYWVVNLRPVSSGIGRAIQVVGMR